MIRVFIIDRQPLFRQGIRSSLSQMPDIEVLGEAENDEEAFSTLETSPPEIILLGTHTTDDLKLCRSIKQYLPSAAVIILTPQLQDEQIFEAIKAQASAYLSRDVGVDELVQAIKRCAGGEYPINESLPARPKLVEQMLQEFHQLSREREAAALILPLTPREKDILGYMAKGYLNKQIASALGVREQTIKNHVTSILRKFNANTRTQAVMSAIKEGLISISEE